jgi:hypothetical protein
MPISLHHRLNNDLLIASDHAMSLRLSDDAGC